MIIEALKNKIFPFCLRNYYEELEEESSECKNEQSSESEDKIPDISTSEQIPKLDKFYGPDLINIYSKEKSLIEILNQLKSYRKDPQTFQKYNNLIVNLLFGLRKLEKDKKRKYVEDEIQNNRLDYLKDLVRTIVDTNKKLDELDESKSKKLDIAMGEKSDKEQEGEGLKIMTSKQMITRLPILLAQLKAGNNKTMSNLGQSIIV